MFCWLCRFFPSESYFCCIFQSETGILGIPHLEFECEQSSLGGRFTTIEGLLKEVKENLEKANPFVRGDAATDSKLKEFLDKLSNVSLMTEVMQHVFKDLTFHG